MLENTHPETMVVRDINLLSSSSLRMASWMLRGLTLLFFVIIDVIAGELDSLSGEVLKKGSKIYRKNSIDALSGASTVERFCFHEVDNSSDWELNFKSFTIGVGISLSHACSFFFSVIVNAFVVLKNLKFIISPVSTKKV